MIVSLTCTRADVFTHEPLLTRPPPLPHTSWRTLVYIFMWLHDRSVAAAGLSPRRVWEHFLPYISLHPFTDPSQIRSHSLVSLLTRVHFLFVHLITQPLGHYIEGCLLLVNEFCEYIAFWLHEVMKCYTNSWCCIEKVIIQKDSQTYFSKIL